MGAAIGQIRVLGPGATMEQLAKAGGVTKPILYRHFGDRDGLIGAIAERFSADLMASLAVPLQAASAQEALHGTIDAYVQLLERDPYVYGFLMHQTTPGMDSRSTFTSLIDVLATQVAVLMGERLGAAGRDTGAAVPWAYGIVGMVHQAGNWWIGERTMSRTRLVADLTELLWHGLAGANLEIDRRGARDEVAGGS